MFEKWHKRSIYFLKRKANNLFLLKRTVRVNVTFECAIFRGEESYFRRILRFAKIVKNNAGWLVIQLHVTFANLCISLAFARNRSPGVWGEHDDNTSHPNAKFRRGLSDGRKNFSRFRFPRVLRWAGKQRIFKVVLDFYISPTDVQCTLFMTPTSLRKSWNCFSRFPTRPCGYGFKLCFSSLLIRHFAD